MSRFEVGVTALRAPAQRFKQIGSDLAAASRGAAHSAGNGSAAAGAPSVSAAADVFKAGVESVLAALGDDANLLGDKVQRAGVTYEAVDRTAMPTTSGDGDGGGGGPPAPRRVTSGDSLWGIASAKLGPDASNADLRSEANRWYEANRDRIGPDRQLNEGSTLRDPDGARTG